MFTFIVVIHVIACTVLVVTVLLQQGKGAEIGAVFGSSEAIFGSTGPATLLSKVTTVSAVVFMLTSLSLTYLSIHNRGESVMQRVQQAPVVPTGIPAMPAVPEAGKKGLQPVKPVKSGSKIASGGEAKPDKGMRSGKAASPSGPGANQKVRGAAADRAGSKAGQKQPAGEKK